MRIHHVVSSILEKYGGPSNSVPALCNALADAGHEVTLHTFAPAPALVGRRFELRTYRWEQRVAAPVGLTWDMLPGLRAAARSGEILHVHGLWMLPNILPAAAVLGTHCKLVYAPRGMLDSWSLAQSARRKRWLWRFAQGPAVRRAALLHATAPSEAASMRTLGLGAPIALVPNGVEIPPEADTAQHGGPLRTLLFLSRLHPKKGLDELLRAWGLVQRSQPDWQLLIVGPDNDAYLPSLRALADELALARIHFRPAAYGAEKVAHLRAAQLYVLPTHSENFGLGVAEALAHGLPAIVGRGAPWASLATERAGWHVDNDVAALASCLREALACPPEVLHEMGRRGRAFVTDAFSWSRSARDLAEAYAWASTGTGPTPSCVAGEER